MIGAIVLAAGLAVSPGSNVFTWEPDYGLRVSPENTIIIGAQKKYKFENGILWNDVIAGCTCVEFSRLTDGCKTRMCFEIGLKDDGSVVWRETEERE